MRILWVSNAPWTASGYAEQAALFLPRFQQAGHEVFCLANYGISGAGYEWNGIPVLPGDGARGSEAMPIWHERLNPDIVIWLADAWPLKPKLWGDIPVALWAPVDHYPMPRGVYAVLREPHIRPIAMSKFGERMMQDRPDLDPLYVPHGVDTKLFRPISAANKASVRRDMGVPEDAFLVGMVAANSSQGEFPRKGYPQALEAFQRFLDRHDDAWLYCHTKPVSALNLEELIIVLNGMAEHPGRMMERVKFPPEGTWHMGLPREQMPAMFGAFDVLLNPSMGEGFGVPIIEAQACGIPVIASDHSAMTEITQAGWLVKGEPWWNEAQKAFGLFPSIRSIEDALEAAYAERHNTALRNAAAVAMQPYDADQVMADYWTPALAALEAGLHKPREVGPLPNPNGNRAQRRAKKKQRA